MSNRTCIILNPAAKGERARRLTNKLRDLLPEAVLKVTRCAGDAEALAERAVQQGYDCVVAAGGDGTLNEVVNGIAEHDVALGVLPVGTVNVFAMEMGIPFRVEDAARVVKEGRERLIDLAQANDQWFIQLAGVGLDAQIVRDTEWESKKTFGPLSYVFTLTELAGRKPPRLKIKDEERGEIEGSFVLVGNGKFYGGPFKIFPDGEIDDGLLDVCVFKRVSHIDMLRYFRGILVGRHTFYKDVEYFHSKSVRVWSDDPSVPVEVDGELYGTAPVSFQAHSRKLRVIVPDGGN